MPVSVEAVVLVLVMPDPLSNSEACEEEEQLAVQVAP